MNRYRLNRPLAVLAVVLALALAQTTGSCFAAPLQPSAYPHFRDDLHFHEMESVLNQSLSYLRALPAATRYTVGGTTFPVQRLIDSAVFFQQLLQSHPSPAQLNRQIKRFYTVFRINGSHDAQSNRMLVTGYYQPFFQGSLVRHPPFVHPLYAVPDTLVVRKTKGRKKTVGRLQDGRFLPFWTRQDIERDHLLNGQELAWLQDPFDAFVLHVQGSGVLHLTDGTVRGVHYAQSNGRPYRSIGKYLVDTGRMRLADVNMDSLRQYISDHPEEREKILHHNESFIFFHWSKPGPAIGSLGRQLTEGRSIAADQQWFPPGALAFLDSRRPVMKNGEVVTWKPMQRFVSVQDTGSALNGPNRVDVFWGSGEQAGQEAGRMKEDGNIYLLLLNTGVHPSSR